MGDEPEHAEVVNRLLDLQAQLRGDPASPPQPGDTIVDAPVQPTPATPSPSADASPIDMDGWGIVEPNGRMTSNEPMMSDGGPISVREDDLDIVEWRDPFFARISIPIADATSITSVPSIPEPTIPPMPEVREEPSIHASEPETGTSAASPPTWDEQIATLAARIEDLQSQVSVVAEELWRLAAHPPEAARSLVNEADAPATRARPIDPSTRTWP